jgi:hypothetical protein
MNRPPVANRLVRNILLPMNENRKMAPKFGMRETIVFAIASNLLHIAGCRAPIERASG